MQHFRLNHSDIGSGKIFPGEIEARDWIGYHGTSSYYSDSIERDGFRVTKPITDQAIVSLLQIMKKYGVDNTHVSGFRQLASVSFSPISELCLAYCAPNKLGGQGLNHIMDAVNALSSHPLTDDDQAVLSSIAASISDIRRCMPVIYAVFLNGLNAIKFNILTKAVHVTEAILPNRIIAKLCIDCEIDFATINIPENQLRCSQKFYAPTDNYLKHIRP